MNDELNRRIYEREFRDWLPKRVFDAHVHLFRRDGFHAGFEPTARSYMHQLPNREYTLETCRKDAATMLPGHEFSCLCFGTPTGDPDRHRANQYIAKICDGKEVYGLALVSPDDHVDAVRDWITDTPLLGYKPYRDFVRNKPREQVSIHDMLPHPQMALADALGLIVMLHIPRRERLADPDNQREILELADRYPNARIILAHIGRAYFLENVVGYLDPIRTRSNVYVDLAMLNHWEVLAYTFREFPADRILFGTDMPISCLGGKSVEVNSQYAYLMEKDVEIGSSIVDHSGVLQFTSFYYEELRAIRKAAETVDWSRQDLENLFYGNARRMIDATIESKAAALTPHTR